MNNDQVTSLLTTVLIIMIAVLFLLVIVFVVLKLREKKISSEKNKNNNQVLKDKNRNNVSKENAPLTYNKQSIFSFMNFDKIEDDMIIRKNGTRFVMIVECQGINYDLMSDVEKTSTEQGFATFLNTLKEPIQIFKDNQEVINDYRHFYKELERINLKINRYVK